MMDNRSAIRRRYMILMDLGLIVLSFMLVGLIRFETSRGVAVLLARHESLLWLSLLIRLPLYLLFGLYNRLRRYTGAGAITRIVLAGLSSLVLIYIVNFFVLPGDGLPHSDSLAIFLLDGLLNLCFLAGSRFGHRICRSWRGQPQEQPVTGGVDRPPDWVEPGWPRFQNLLISGGAGFIGANFVRYMLEAHPTYRLVVYDNLTYAGNLDNLLGLAERYGDRYVFVQGDICHPESVADAMERYQIDGIVNFAAETHVDRSLMQPGNFARTNGYGTCVLLEQARQFGVRRYHQISTDEVYGQTLQGSFKETDPIDCRSPYSASKAGGDVMALAYQISFGLPVTISRGSNSIGPYQHPEKAVPLFVTNALDNMPLPVYGDGLYERDYQYVTDHCRGIDLILHRGRPGEIYNLGAGREMTAIELARKICDLLGKPYSLIHFVEDRPGQDRRYSLDCTKIMALGWRPRYTTERALKETIQWYVANEWWWRKIKQGEYRDYYRHQYEHRLKQATQAAATPAANLAWTSG